MTGFRLRAVAIAWDFLISIGWLEPYGIPQDGATLVPQEGAGIPQDDAHLTGSDETGSDETTGSRDARPIWTAEEIEAIYRAYPRHVAPIPAEKAIRKALEEIAADGGINGTQTPPQWLLLRTQKYAAAWKGKETKVNGRDIRPYPASWFNAGRYDDDEREWP
jgi:hypothetical protein